MRPGGLRGGVLAAAAATLLCASSASATEVTIGPPDVFQIGAETFTCEAEACPANETFTQLSSSSGIDTAPAPGVITSWSLLSTSGRFELRVLEPTGPFLAGAGTSEILTSKGGGNGQVPTELFVTTGGRIGVDVLDVGEEKGIGAIGEVGARIGTFSPIVEEGQAASDPNSFKGERLLLNAQEELTPIVTSVSPASGPSAGGNTVTITGKYLDSARNVIFGSQPATSFSVDLSGEHITAKAPASPASTVEVHVSNLHSTSEPVPGDRYTFLAPTPTTGSTAAPPGQGGPGAGPGTAALQVSAFSESASRWRLGSALAHISSVPVGTSFAYELNEPADLALAFARVLPGRRVNGRCVALGRANRSRPKCNRPSPAGSLAITGHAGRNKIGFQGRLSRAAKLTPGNYTATVTTPGARGVKTLTRSLSFTILP
jgi:IPT/TIG domain